MVTLLFLASCATAPDGDAAPSTDIPRMDARRAAIRLSLDLRGVRPSADEFAQVEADPDHALATLTDTWLQDPRFGDRVRDMWSEVYLTRTETLPIAASQYGLDDQAAFEQAVGEEPLRILGYVADHDLPYTELVMGDWTVANPLLAQIWPIEWADGQVGWQKTRYTDGRPAAGVLATNSLWWRYTSTASNANRKRANAISRIFLCNDYLVRPIEFDRNVNLLDEQAVNEALTANPACVNCHNSLDPLASYLFGFWWYDYNNPGEASYYFPEREQRWRDYTNRAPGYYGEPGYSLADLGRQVAADHRYPECAVQQAYELLLRRDADLADADALAHHRDDFINGGLTVRALVKSVVSDPLYLAGDTDAEGAVPLKMVTPDLLASEIEGLTGFSYTYAGFDMLRSDRYGFRTLAGGADGYDVTATATSANATLVLVHERLAELAAWYAVESEPARLFQVDFTETPDTDRAAMVAQVQSLHRALYGTVVADDSDEVEAALALWSDLYTAERDVRAAWAGVLAALLRDPDMLYY